MRPFRRHRIERRRAVPLLALFVAVLANATLVPLLHFAIAGPAAGDTTLHAAHVAASHHVAHDRGESDGGAGGVGHQVCHFCRVVVAALPPPPSVVIERLSASETVGWSIVDNSFRPEEYFRSSHLPRGPPPIV